MAQPAHQRVPQIPGHSAARPALANAVLQKQAEMQSDFAAKPTALTQRLLATSSYEAGALSDSSRYYYSTLARGAAHDPKNPYSYDNFFSPITGLQVPPNNVNIRIQYIQPDSVRTFSLNGPGGFQRYTYNSANKPTLVYNDFGFYRDRYQISYNAAGDDVACDYYQDSTFGLPLPGLVLNTTQRSVFNAQHRVVSDSIANEMGSGIAPSQRLLWSYNAANRVIGAVQQDWDGAAWASSARAVVTYLANGLTQKVQYEEWDGTAWMPNYIDSFGYNGNNPSYTYNGYSFYDSDSGSLQPGGYYTYHLNTAGNWDSATSYYYEPDSMGFLQDGKFVIGYNSYQNWDTILEFYDDDGDGVIDPMPAYVTHYYYQTYDPAGVKDAPTALSTFTLAPNPTTGLLRMTWNASAAPARYSLTDLQGRTLSGGPVMAGASRMELDLSGNVPGVYILMLTASDGTVLHREKVVRQ